MDINAKVFTRIKETKEKHQFAQIQVVADSLDVAVEDLTYDGKNLLETFELKKDGTSTKAKVSGCLAKPSCAKTPGDSW